jgi:hypothetical protein
MHDALLASHPSTEGNSIQHKTTESHRADELHRDILCGSGALKLCATLW